MMANNAVTFALFALVCLLLLSLPFIPAYREWRHPSDVAALPISADYSSDIDHFARRLHADAMAKLNLGPSTGFETFDFVTLPVETMRWDDAETRLIARRSIHAAAGIHSSRQLYVQGDMRTGPESSFSALYASGNIELGSGSRIYDWAHAGGRLRMGKNGVALRRVSAGMVIELDTEVWFERLQAPTLQFGMPAHAAEEKIYWTQQLASYADLPNAIEQTPSLFLIRGDCILPEGNLYHGSLVVTGFLVIGKDTTVIGDVKAREGVSISRRGRVEGAITCEKRIYIFKDANAFGPVVSESDILLGARAVIGLPDALTTVTARNVIVEEGATVHGEVWAHDIGMVKSE
jgi:cytoskeletal protein CcmA (bactofilin family)